MTKRSPFWKELWPKHLLLLIAITAAVLGLEYVELLTGPELWVLDHVLLPDRAPSPNIHLVEISDQDYDTWFHSTSPLKPELVLGLIDDIVARQPRVIGVDIDTRDWVKIDEIPCTAPTTQQIIFPEVVPPETGKPKPQSQQSKSSTADAQRQVTTGLRCFMPTTGPPIVWAEITTNEDEPLELGPVLGLDPATAASNLHLPPEQLQTFVGIPRFPVDPDDVLRKYSGEFKVKGFGGKMYSLARSVAQQYWPTLSVTKSEVFIKYAGTPGVQAYAETDAGVFLRNECDENKSFAERYKVECGKAISKSPGRPNLPYLINEIVLVGGAYQAARDLHQTRIGNIPGVEVIAQAIDSDLHGGGIRQMPESVSAVLDLLTAIVVVYLYYRLKSLPFYGFLAGWGLVFVVVLLCIGLIKLKLAWLNVIPVVVSANLEQVWHHGALLRKEQAHRNGTHKRHH